MSRTTITKALGELNSEHTIDGNIRRSGGGRKFVESNYPGIEEKIRKIIDGKTYGDPIRVLSYTTESLRKIQTELEKDGIFVSHITTGKILDAMGYSKQINQKMPQTGKPHPDRNAQFEYINAMAAAFLKKGEPVISAGLTVICVRDDTEYELAKKVSDEDFATIKLLEIAPFEAWNYRILPR
jgi:hypothetical protein